MRIVVSLILSLPNIGAYAILAVGIVMIYRASRVLNLAHGAMAMIPAYVLYTLSATLHIPLVVAVPLALAAGGVLGWGVERVFVRRLRTDGPTAQTVGTVAALGLLVALAAKLWGTTPLRSVRVFPEGYVSISRSSISYGQLLLFAVMLVVTGALLVLFQRTDVGLLMRGTAENRRAAALMGVDPDRITAFAWVLGGGLAGLSGIMLASVTNLHPYTLSQQALPAFVAALIGGLGSLPGAVAGAGIVGAVLGLVPLIGPLADVQGASQFVLAVVAIVVMATRGRALVGGDIRAEQAAGGGGEVRAVRLPGGRAATLAGLAVWAVFPFLPLIPFTERFTLLGGANRAAVFTVVATSLVLLTGWVGQISLGHAALVGVGAYATGWLVSGLGIPFPLNLPLAGGAAAAVAAVLGFVAVRVRGLYLAVATLIFSWMADEFLFRQTWFTRHPQIDVRPIGQPGTFPFFDFSDRRVFYYLAFAVAGLGLYAVANLRDSKTGRAMFAVRGSEMAAASLGIDVVRTKLLAFSISGFLAGAAGNLIMTDSRSVTPDRFLFTTSFFFLAIAVVGGVSSLGGAVAAAMLFASLDVIFFKVRLLSGFLDLTSTGLLAFTLLAYRGGLARAGAALAGVVGRSRRAVEALRTADRALEVAARDLRWLGRRVRLKLRERLELAGLVVSEELRAASSPSLRPVPAIAGGALNGRRGVALLAAVRALAGRARGSGETVVIPQDREAAQAPVVGASRREDRPPVLEAEGITVRFGGLVAVDGVSLQVREGEIVGLIGPNGAGKTVTFNSIAGIVTPTSGRVRLYGRDVTDLPVHERAWLGVARTFQAIQLFPQLSVRDNLLVATHLHNPTGFLSHLAVTDRALAAERQARGRVREVIALLGMEAVADRRAADLPFGVLRMVEVARALVTGFRFIMLDEPASGLDNTETDRLAEILLRVRDLGVTLLLIEHDVKMVISVSDYMYVLDRGRLIAEGPPEAVKRNPAVVAAYLGQPVGA